MGLGSSRLGGGQRLGEREAGDIGERHRHSHGTACHMRPHTAPSCDPNTKRHRWYPGSSKKQFEPPTYMFFSSLSCCVFSPLFGSFNLVQVQRTPGHRRCRYKSAEWVEPLDPRVRVLPSH